MKNLNRVPPFSIFLSIFFIVGCFPNGDIADELPGDYVYIEEGRDDKVILCHIPNHQEIYPEVIGLNYNAKFIVVAQKPRYEGHCQYISFNIRCDSKRYPTNSSEEVVRSDKEADSVLNHSPFYASVFKNSINYWIISTDRYELFGPYNKKEYEEKRVELNVPGYLEINYDR
jgi:hypothetical protein